MRPRTRAAVLAAASAMALVGCGSTSRSTPPPPTTPATSTPAPTTTPTTTPTPSITATTATTAPTTTAASTPATTTGLATCTTAQLAISLQPPLGSAGAAHYQFVVRNSSTAACNLFGYPGVSFLSAAGAQIGPPAERGTNVVLARVTLQPGGAGYVRLDVTDPGIPPCAGPGTVWRVRFYPPDSTAYTLVPPPGTMVVCISDNTSTYTASTVGPVSAAPTQ